MTLAAVFVVYALAVARATRLINQDKILNAPRERLVAWAWARRYGRHAVMVRSESGEDLGWAPMWTEAKAGGAIEPMPAYLVTCAWCASIYVGAVAAPLWYWLGTSPWLLVPAAALAFSFIAGFVAQFGE